MSILLQKKNWKKKTLHLEGPQAKQTKLKRWPGQSSGISRAFSLPPSHYFVFPGCFPPHTEIQFLLHSPSGLQDHFLRVGQCHLESPEENEKQSGCIGGDGLLQPASEDSLCESFN